MQITPGSTDRTILIFARDTLTGLGKTGLVAASINARFTRVETDNDVTITAVTEADLTALTDAHADGGWYPVDATNAPGLYRFDLPDAVCATGAWEAVVTIVDAGANNFEIAPTRIELGIAGDVADAVHDEVVEGSTTLRQMLRGYSAALLSKLSGGGTATEVFRDIGDTKNRISATVDSSGNRTAITLDLT